MKCPAGDGGNRKLRFKRTFHTIDTHTGGEPTRNVVGGIPAIPGATMRDKMVYMMEHQDDIRKLLVYEPRGNSVMSGTVITPPCDPRADIGVLFFEVGFWMPMCGHDTIGVATALVESGMVPVSEPVTHITLDTAAGLVRLEVDVEDGAAKRVAFTNAPAYVMKEDVLIKTDEFGGLKLDIAYGGNVYAILPAKAVGLDITPENGGALVRAGNIIKGHVNRQVSVAHPELEFIDKVTHVEFYGPPKNPQATAQNAVVIPPGAIDRSPCGTGTSAKMAVLAAKGKLAKGQPFVHESIIGSLFYGEIVGETEVAGIPAVVPRVAGSAWVTGIHTYVLAPDDPFPCGFELG
jgi:proline racemase